MKTSRKSIREIRVLHRYATLRAPWGCEASAWADVLIDRLAELATFEHPEILDAAQDYGILADVADTLTGSGLPESRFTVVGMRVRRLNESGLAEWVNFDEALS